MDPRVLSRGESGQILFAACVPGGLAGGRVLTVTCCTSTEFCSLPVVSSCPSRSHLYNHKHAAAKALYRALGVV